MITEYIRYSIPEGRRAEFERAYTEAQRSLDESEHCLSWELSHGVEEPTNYILRIEWDSLDGHEHGFRSSPEFQEFLGWVRPFIDQIEEMRHYERTEVSGRLPDTMGGSPPSLFEWAGGEAAFARLIDAFYDRVEADDLLAGLFGGQVGEEHRRNVTAWWSEVFGGPDGYTAQLGGYDRMVGKHRGIAITPEQRFRFASLMSLAADDAGLPDDPEFRSAFVAYVEWGTRIALDNSQPDAEVVEDAPVPRWGWGEAPPFEP